MSPKTGSSEKECEWAGKKIFHKMLVQDLRQKMETKKMEAKKMESEKKEGKKMEGPKMEEQKKPTQEGCGNQIEKEYGFGPCTRTIQHYMETECTLNEKCLSCDKECALEVDKYESRVPTGHILMLLSAYYEIDLNKFRDDYISALKKKVKK